MTDRRQKTKTLLFIGFLLLAGVCNLLTRTSELFFNTLMFCMNFLIYMGLLLYWMLSVRARLLPTRARNYVFAAAGLMLFYLTLRVFKYRVAGLVPAPSRYAVYGYWIPLVLVPTLFLMTCICIHGGWRERKISANARSAKSGKSTRKGSLANAAAERTERGGLRRKEYLLLIPAFALCLLAMTNDLHGLVYRMKIDLSLFAVNTGTYTIGIGFYLLYAWMLLATFAGLFLLFRVTRKSPVRTTLAVIGVIIVWAGLIMLRLLIFDRYNIPGMYQVPEIHIFCMLGIMEICIRKRLIAYNENYVGFFAQLDISMAVTDRELVPVYTTAVPVLATKNEREQSLKAPLYIKEETRLSGMPISAGFAFWEEDETELNRERRRLASANELLSEENELIAVENQLREKKAHLDAQLQVYDRIARELYPKQKMIEALLAEVDPKTPEFPRALAKCCVLNAYSKRKSNLLLLNEETLPESNRELFLSLQETARFLRCCGVEAAAIGEEYSDIPLAQVHDLYDTFETVVETYLPYLKSMTVSLMTGGIRLAMEMKSISEMTDSANAASTGAAEAMDSRNLPKSEMLPVLPATKLPVKCMESDELTFVTIYKDPAGGRV